MVWTNYQIFKDAEDGLMLVLFLWWKIAFSTIWNFFVDTDGKTEMLDPAKVY